MVIAIPYNEKTAEIGEHFGKAERFKLYEVDDYGMIVEEAVLTPYGQGHDAMCSFLMDYNTGLVICRHMGDAARELLESNSITVIQGIEGNADEIVKLALANAIESTASGCGCGCSGGCGDGDGCGCGSHESNGGGCGGCCS